MKVIVGYPPNIDELDAAFGVRGRQGVIFAFGQVIYNPDGIQIPSQLFSHEAVHGIRQQQYIDGISKWWQRYIDDAEFRLHEEIPAHQAEYEAYCAEIHDRNRRRAMLKSIAKRLSGPLYGNMINFRQARGIIKA